MLLGKRLGGLGFEVRAKIIDTAEVISSVSVGVNCGVNCGVHCG